MHFIITLIQLKLNNLKFIAIVAVLSGYTYTLVFQESGYIF